MTTPQLVCYDKNQWKTLQQLQNWNREWNELFVNCYFCTSLTVKLNCSWMDEQFAQQLLSGAARMPNIQSVAVSLGSKRLEVGDVLAAVGKAKFFPSFSHDFKLLQWSSMSFNYLFLCFFKFIPICDLYVKTHINRVVKSTGGRTSPLVSEYKLRPFMDSLFFITSFL